MWKDLGKHRQQLGTRKVYLDVYTSHYELGDRPTNPSTYIGDDENGVRLEWPDDETAIRNHALLVQIVSECVNPFEDEDDEE